MKNYKYIIIALMLSIIMIVSLSIPASAYSNSKEFDQIKHKNELQQMGINDNNINSITASIDHNIYEVKL